MEDEEGKESVTAPILQLSAEKMTRYGMFLMDYGVVGCVIAVFVCGCACACVCVCVCVCVCARVCVCFLHKHTYDSICLVS